MKVDYINKPIHKVDAMALVTGKPVYTEDIAPKDCLVVLLLRSPHAFARIRSIDTSRAKAVDGIACVITYEDVPQKRFTLAGQSYPEPSPYDRLILDEYVRYVGDPVAIVAGEDMECAQKAMKLIKVEYEILTPVFDFHTAKDNPILVHPEDNWRAISQVGGDPKRNLCASGGSDEGDVDKIFAESEVLIEETYHTQACQQVHMETLRAFCEMDTYGRLKITSSTQIPFHVRRIISHALDIPKTKVRVIKPRIGGGFGAKQTAVCEMYPAVVTWMTGKPAMYIMTRRENQIASSPRHEMEMHVKIGATKDGRIRAIEINTLSNTGAYGEHGPTTVGLSGHKSIPMYVTEAYRFTFDVVYTNHMSSGAYRGYGATQGIFALESAIDELAHQIGMDPVELRLKNTVKTGMVMPAYYYQLLESCNLDACVRQGAKMAKWEEGYKAVKLPNGKIRGIGCAMAMQGSGISAIDQGSVRLRLMDDGYYSLSIGASDMGTGCDTILAQMAATELECELHAISVNGVDTDVSPYDTGSYASSTTYVTGMATVNACRKLRKMILEEGAKRLGVEAADAEFDGEYVYSLKEDKKLSLSAIGNAAQSGTSTYLTVEEMWTSKVSPPPFMSGFATIELDPETGCFDLVDFASVVDCGTVINSNLARVQAEGGILQGIGMAMFEEIQYGSNGKLYNNSLMQYRIPNRKDFGNIRVEFNSSHEPTGPFGAKSIGEVVIDTSSPAIANAVANAAGVRIRELPITPEKILRAMGKI